MTVNWKKRLTDFFFSLENVCFLWMNKLVGFLRLMRWVLQELCIIFPKMLFRSLYNFFFFNSATIPHNEHIQLIVMLLYSKKVKLKQNIWNTNVFNAFSTVFWILTWNFINVSKIITFDSATVRRFISDFMKITNAHWEKKNQIKWEKKVLHHIDSFILFEPRQTHSFIVAYETHRFFLFFSHSVFNFTGMNSTKPQLHRYYRFIVEIVFVLFEIEMYQIYMYNMDIITDTSYHIFQLVKIAQLHEKQHHGTNKHVQFVDIDFKND